MKICRDCGNVGDDLQVVCSTCGSHNLATAEEKLCTYCKSRVALGTIICPYCHRVLPPEKQREGEGFIPAPNKIPNINQFKEKEQVQSPQPIQPIQPIRQARKESNIQEPNYFGGEFANTQSPKIFQPQTDAEVRSGVVPAFLTPTEEYGKDVQSALDMDQELVSPKRKRVENAEKISKAPQSRYKDSEEFQALKKSARPENPFLGYILFVCVCAYIAIGLFTPYMHHSMGNVAGYEMSASVFPFLVPVFPSEYPYILYGTGLSQNLEVAGSYMPFAMNVGIISSLIAGLGMMLKIAPKPVVATLNVFGALCQIGSVGLMAYIFGINAISVGSIFLVVGSMGIAVCHSKLTE